jgi:ParB family chromosome partitioning protein
MEEAQAFRNLIEQRHYDIPKLVSRFGKSETFIRMRLKLNDLSEVFRDLLNKEVIGIGHAQELCKLDESVQKDICEQLFLNMHQSWWTAPTVKDLKRHIERHFMLNLEDASFNTFDPKLDPAAGSCTSCTKNTASHMLLFPDTDKFGVCMDKVCFKNKSAIHFNIELQRIQEQEPDILIGYQSHIYGEEEKNAKELIKSGVPAIELSYHAGFYEVPKPDLDDIEPVNREDFDDEDEYQEALNQYNMDVEEYIKDKKEYEQRISSGTLRKAFIIAGNDKGKILYYERTGNAKDSAPIANSREELINSQVAELKAKDNRDAELTFEKTYFAVKELIGKNGYTKKTHALTDVEVAAMLTIMIGNIDDDLEAEIFGKEKNRHWVENKLKFPAAQTVTPDQHVRIVRNWIKRQLDNGTPVSQESEAKALIAISSEIYSDETKFIELELQGKYLKRKEGIETKIAALKEQAL